MTPGKLFGGGAKPVASNSPRPLRADDLVLAAYNGSAGNRGKLGQRERRRIRVPCLRSKPVDCSLRGRFITVGEQQLPGKFEIDPCCSILRIRLTQPLHIGRIQHGLVTQLIENAPADVRNQGAQVHQMPYRSARRTNGPVLPASECPTTTTSSLHPSSASQTTSA